MSDETPARARIDDLLAVDGKAELIDGRIVSLGGLGLGPARVAGRILRHLDDHAREIGLGEVFTGTIVFAVPKLPSGRESFSPDASYYVGPLPGDPMGAIPGPPTLAVEIRSEGDRGPAAEAAMAANRVDYFAAGTLVVWDVDPVAGLVDVYRPDEPGRPTRYARGQEAEAEPALTGWRVAVDAIFPATSPA